MTRPEVTYDELRASWDPVKGELIQTSRFGDILERRDSRVNPIQLEVSRLCNQKSKDYKAAEYASEKDLVGFDEIPLGQAWRRHLLEELELQVWERIIQNDLLRKSFDKCRDLKGWRIYIAKFGVEWTILGNERQRRTPIDNLVKRSDKILNCPPFQSATIDGKLWYCLGREPHPADPLNGPRDKEFAEARRRVFEVGEQNWDRNPSPDYVFNEESGAFEEIQKRNPKLLSESQLRDALMAIGIAMPDGFRKQDVDKIFSARWPFFETRTLRMDKDWDSDEGDQENVAEKNLRKNRELNRLFQRDQASVAHSTPSSDLDQMTEDVMRGIRDQSDDHGVAIFHHGSRGSYDKIGRELGIDPRTAKRRYENLVGLIKEQLTLLDLGPGDQEELFDMLMGRIDEEFFAPMATSVLEELGATEKFSAQTCCEVLRRTAFNQTPAAIGVDLGIKDGRDVEELIDETRERLVKTINALDLDAGDTQLLHAQISRALATGNLYTEHPDG